MQKKIIALAVAAAFSAPAFAADTADFTVYGKAFLTVDSVKSDIAPANTKTSTMGVNSDASRLGFKGSEDLGDGLKAVYQYEVEMDANGSTAAGLGKTRNSGVGMDGGFGKVIVGIWDTPFKVVHNKLELFDNTTVYSAINLIGHTGANNYNTRQAKMVQYWSPKVGSLQAAVMYSPDTNTSTLTTAKNTSRMSVSATYDQDALYAAFGYESRPDQTTVGKSDSGVRLAAMYSLGDAALGATVERLTTQAATSVSQTNLEFVGKYKMDKNVFALSVAKAGNVGTAATTGATQMSLRFGHNFSKRTELFAAYTSLKNNTATGAYSLSTVFAAQTGSTQSAMGVGLIHSF